MSERLGDSGEDGGQGAEWDGMPSYEEVRANERAESTEALKSLGAEFRKLERDFAAGFPEAQKKYPDEPERQAKYMDFYVRKYEGWLRHNRFLAGLNVRTAEITNPYYLGGLERIAVSDPMESIEVASARFYSERLSAVQEVATPEEKEVLRETFAKVEEHLLYEYTPRADVDETYDVNRAAAHNRMIEQLNTMNGIAEAHGLTPFTARNFRTSVGYREKNDPNRMYGQQLSSDRAIVARYFDAALPDKVAPLRRKLERENRFDY